MIQYDYGVICESAIVDQQTNQLSLIKIADGFNFTALPGGLPRLYLVTVWSKTKDSVKAQVADARFSLESSDKKPDETSPQVQFKIDVPSDKKNIRVIMEVLGIPITSVGEHNFIVEIKEKSEIWKTVGSITFDVTNNPLPTDVTGLPI